MTRNIKLVDTKWPTLRSLHISQDRTGFLGGSDANTILCGDQERVRNLWREKRGETTGLNLFGVLPVMLGVWSESFNRQWFESITGEEVSRVQVTSTCKLRPWRRCSLDGFIEGRHAVWEAKHTNAFSKSGEVLERYMPQLQHNMAVVGVDRAVLSVIFGNHRFEIFEVAADWLYQVDLLQAEEDFWDCVISGQEPVAVPAPPPPRPLGVREICLEGNNAWASAAADWLQNRSAARAHAHASATIKSLVEDDVSRAFGHHIEAKRSKSGAVTIRELAQ